MKAIFIDTAAWLALINKTDALHEKAKKIRNRLLKESVQLLVTDYILVEIANTLSRIPFRTSAIQLINFIQASSNIQLVEINREIYGEAWEMYRSRLDKEWSLTDCTSFVIMNRVGIKDAFTSDHHFEQAGFNILMKD